MTKPETADLPLLMDLTRARLDPDFRAWRFPQSATTGTDSPTGRDESVRSRLQQEPTVRAYLASPEAKELRHLQAEYEAARDALRLRDDASVPIQIARRRAFAEAGAAIDRFFDPPKPVDPRHVVIERHGVRVWPPPKDADGGKE